MYLKTELIKTSVIFTARCYASAVLAMGLCLSVRLSVRHKSVFFWHVSFLHPSYTALKGNSVISKNKALPSRTLS